ncbi:hypothetical protein ACFSMW_12095 [Virgibacillus halophilus]|uniref:Lipoprotein n=1 Tax=Tigheibacillus halophilus TaxID=361280 RepID=A0ABU5C993_9BACI|nr:hypothetical protein [Virgibacillus halophilus]
MKKIYLLAITILVSVVITGCSSSKDSTSKDKTETTILTNTGDKEKDKNKNEKKKDIYQIAETANTESSNGGHPYSVKVNSFEIINDKSASGVSMKDAGYTKDDPDARFAVANATNKNTGDKPFVPNDEIEAQIESKVTPQKMIIRILLSRKETKNLHLVTR